MQFLSGHKTGSDLMLLPEHRQISLDNLWAIRVLIALFVFNALATAAAPAQSATGPVWAVGLLAGATVFYWLLLRFASSSRSE